MRSLKTTTRRGFTLLELVIVLLILGILSLIAIPTFARVQENTVKQAVRTTAQAVARDAQAIAMSDSTSGGFASEAILELAAQEAQPGYVDLDTGDNTIYIVEEFGGRFAVVAITEGRPPFVGQAFIYTPGSGQQMPTQPLISQSGSSVDGLTLYVTMASPWDGEANAVTYELSSAGQSMHTWAATSASTSIDVSGWADGDYDLQARAQMSDGSWTAYSDPAVLMVTILNGSIQ